MSYSGRALKIAPLHLWSHMRLKMETHISGDVLILHCFGRIVFGDEAAAFRERIKHILLGTGQIVVNLSGIPYLGSRRVAAIAPM